MATIHVHIMETKPTVAVQADGEHWRLVVRDHPEPLHTTDVTITLARPGTYNDAALFADPMTLVRQLERAADDIRELVIAAAGEAVSA